MLFYLLRKLLQQKILFHNSVTKKQALRLANHAFGSKPEEKIQRCKLLYMWYLKDAEWSLESTPGNVKHSANKEGTCSALLIKVYYTQNLAICELLLERSYNAFRGCKWMHLQKCWTSSLDMPLCLRLWAWGYHGYYITPSTLELNWLVLGWSVLKWSHSSAGISTAEHYRTTRASYNTFNLLDSLLSFFLFHTWNLIHGPLALGSREGWHTPDTVHSAAMSK